MNARERIYVLVVVGLIGAAVLTRPEVEELDDPAAADSEVVTRREGGVLYIEDRDPQPSRPAPAPRLSLVDAEGIAHCNARLSSAARVLFQEGSLYRWTTTNPEVRFPVRRATDDPDVRTYRGGAIEFQDDDGSWVRAVYECDFNSETGEVVEVRTAPMR